MPSLSSSIVNQQVASVRDVEEALSRQSLYGGDLITNLLELAAVSEEHLSQVLAESHELDAAPTGELPVASEQVRRLVPGDIARRFALYPLQERDGVLTIAVAEPLPTETEQDLSFSLGTKIVQNVALLVRVRQAIARDYGTQLDRRSLRVLARLSGKPDPSPSSLPSRPEAPTEKRQQTLRPNPTPAPTPATTNDRNVPRAPAMPDFSSSTRLLPTGQARRLGPFTVAMAERALSEAESRDDVLRAFFDFASQYFDYSALFAVQGDLAEGRDASGAGAARSRIVAVGVPLDLPSAMSRAREAATYQLTRLGSAGLDGALAKDLERRPGRVVLFLPVQVRARTVLILYGDHGDRDVELSAIGDVISFAPLLSNAFERLILRKRAREKAGDGAATSLRFDGKRAAAQPFPNDGERKATLASLIAPVSRSAPPPTVAAPVISIGPASPRAQLDSEPLASGGLAHSNELPEDGWDSIPAPAPFPTIERGTKPGVGIGLPPRPAEATPKGEHTPNALESEASSRRPVSLPRLQLMPEGPPPLPASEAPEIDVSDRSGYFDEENDDFGPISEENGAPLAPASRALAYSARPLPPRDATQDVRLPTVIVDLASDTQEFVDRLLEGDLSAGDKLVQIGDTAITVLASIFPGPITGELRRGSGDAQGKASECGPVLRTLARMGTRPVPFIAVRTADGDPVVRAWATRLLGEMPSAESAQAVARRLTDDDSDVRRAALAAGQLLLNHAEAAEALQAKIAETVSDSTRPEDARHTLIEALAELRAPLVIPTLVRLLEDRSPDIVRSVYWALGVIARQDFGTKGALWEEWWLANSRRHRIEWLIDSLMHENQELRRTAGDELKSLTKEYFGYYDDLPKKERERAQERYRQWWESKGKARFR